MENAEREQIEFQIAELERFAATYRMALEVLESPSELRDAYESLLKRRETEIAMLRELLK